MAGIGFDVPEAAALPSFPQGELDLTSTYRARTGKAFVRLIWIPKTRHLHLDTALRSAFDKVAPKPNTPLKLLRKSFAMLKGGAGEGFIHAFLTIPLGSLPPSGGLIFAGNGALRFRTAKSEIALTGATLDFKDASIDRIRWTLGKESVFLSVDARRNLTITDSCLVNALQTVDSAISTFILRKSHDAKNS